MFIPPTIFDVRDRHGGFTALLTSGDTLWIPGSKAPRDTLGKLVEGSIKRDDFWQVHKPVVSANYKLTGYRHPVKVWWHPTGERIA